MWRNFWAAVGARPIIVHEIRSRLSLDDALTLGFGPVRWQANRLADKPAEEGAKMAQIPFHSTRKVLEGIDLRFRVLEPHPSGFYVLGPTRPSVVWSGGQGQPKGRGNHFPCVPAPGES